MAKSKSRIYEEINNIQPAFNHLIADTQMFNQAGREKMNTFPILKQWAKNKKSFYKAFGNKCIYQYPEKVEVKLSTKAQKKIFIEFMDRLKGWICNEQNQGVDRWIPFLNFLDKQSYLGFFSNEVLFECEHNIPTGMKLVKAFKYFFPEDMKEEMIHWQQIASEYIQKDKIAGYFCLSIHPLDFLTSSVNNHNWRSCHALDGEYAGGNLDYITDSSTVICYLKSKEGNDEELHSANDFIWNSKKWRMLIHFNEEKSVIFGGRQYPFNSREIITVLNKCLNDTGLKQDGYGWSSCWSHWEECYDGLYNSHNDSHCNLDSFVFGYKGKIKMVNEVVKIPKYPLHYNDLLWSSVANPMITYKFNTPEEEFLVRVGGEPVCCICGEKQIPHQDLFVCKDCLKTYTEKLPEGYGKCSICGDLIDLDNDFWEEIDDQLYCRTCWDEKNIEEDED